VFDSEYFYDLEVWKARNELFHFIQQHCDRPAYFWCNYRAEEQSTTTGSVPLECLPIPHQIEWLPGTTVSQFKQQILSGELDPQAWCDNH
jgi:hypothetical protein